MPSRPANLGALLTLAVILVFPASGTRTSGDEPDYARKIKPIFLSHCVACHGPIKQENGLRLDTGESIRKGGEQGPAVIAGESGKSLLFAAITGASGVTRMPPEGEGVPLSQDEISRIAAWIDAGARSPADETPLSDPSRHWSFLPITRPEVPETHDHEGSKNPIDAFVAFERANHGLAPNPPAGKAVELRRVTLDLIGLPPTREELHAYLLDDSPDAYERVVDRLLAKPAHGERYARHWMDIWRYSDWYGRRAVPDVWNSAPQVWRWRDWITRSLNEDRGYDRMVMEMLAADELSPADDEAVVATGYIVRNWYALNSHQWMKDLVEHTGKAFLGLTFNCAHCHDHKYDPISNEDYFRFRAFFEPVGLRQDRVAGEPDPGPFQKYEYTVLRKVAKFGLVRVFDENPNAETRMYASGDERAVIADRPPVAPGAPAFLPGSVTIAAQSPPAEAYYPGLKDANRRAEADSLEEKRIVALRELETHLAALVAAIENRARLEAQRLEKIRAAAAGPGTAEPALPANDPIAELAEQYAKRKVRLAEARLAAIAARRDFAVQRNAADDIRYRGAAGDLVAASQAASKAERNANLREADEQLLAAEIAHADAQAQVEALAADADKTQALAAVTAAQSRQDTARKTVEAASVALAAETSTYSPLGTVYPASSTGRRRALAQWLTSKENPLTARVAVNHLWSWHFGRPLVETTFDFGLNGKRPSHPALLDWLASELMSGASSGGRESPSGDWRMKSLHRLIVTSKTYRQSGAVEGGHSDPRQTSDPENRWLWRFAPRRLEAEVIRDSLLASAGRLETSMGGEPIENERELSSRRRGLYFSIHPEDGGHPRLLELFDAPDPCDCYRRAESLVPQQALAMLNGPTTLTQSRRLGTRLWSESGLSTAGETAMADQTDSIEAFVVAAFETVLSRGPTESERSACREFLLQQVDLFRATPPPSPSVSPPAPEPSPPISPATAAANEATDSIGAASDPWERACQSLTRVLFSHHEFTTLR